MYFANIYSDDWVEKKKNKHICRLTVKVTYFDPHLCFLWGSNPKQPLKLSWQRRRLWLKWDCTLRYVIMGVARNQPIQSFEDEDVLNIRTILIATFWVCGHISTCSSQSDPEPFFSGTKRYCVFYCNQKICEDVVVLTNHRYSAVEV